MAYGQVDSRINDPNVNPADRNSMAIQAGYTGLDDYNNNRRSTQSSSVQSQASVSPQFSSSDLNNAIASAIKTFRRGMNLQ